MQRLVKEELRLEGLYISGDSLQARIVDMREVFPQAGPEVVVSDNCLDNGTFKQTINKVGANKTRATRYQDLAQDPILAAIVHLQCREVTERSTWLKIP